MARFEVYAETKGPIEPLPEECPVEVLIDLDGAGEFAIEATDFDHAAMLLLDHCKDIDTDLAFQVMSAETKRVKVYGIGRGGQLEATQG